MFTVQTMCRHLFLCLIIMLNTGERTNSNGCPVQQNKPIGKLMSITAIPCVCQSTKSSQRKKSSPSRWSSNGKFKKVWWRKSQIMNPAINNSSVKCLRNCRKFYRYLYSTQKSHLELAKIGNPEFKYHRLRALRFY